MARQPNGTIMILGPDHTGTYRKAIDLKITQRFPIINLGANAKLVMDGEESDISCYKHLSIPPDLRIHLTSTISSGRRGRMFLRQEPLVNEEGSLSMPLLHLFTLISAPVINYPEPRNSSQPKRTWYQGVLISLPADQQYDPERTRIFLDIFIHREPWSADDLAHGWTLPANMRLPKRPALGPHYFHELVRGTGIKPKFFHSFRFGFCEMDVNKSCYVVVNCI